jgi:MFS superfamily sulfate permease-like transporter
MGLSIRIISEQLPQLIGLRIQYPPNVSTFRQIASLFEMKTQLHVPSLVCGLLSLVILLAMAEAQAYLVLKKKFRPASFMPLIFTGVIIFALIGLALYETVPELDLHLSGPFYHWPLPPRLYSDVLPFLQRNASDILVISLLLYAEAQRAYAFCADMDRKVDDRKELFALGLANLVGAFLGCFPTSTSLLRTKAFANTKIKTTLANGLFSGMFTLGVFIASSYLVYYLPKSADAAVVIMIAKGMMELSFFKETLKGGNYLEIFGSVFIIIVSFFLPLPYATVSVLLLVAASITYKLTDPDFIAKVSQKQTNSNMALNNFCTDHPDYFALDMAEFVNFSNASRLGRALKRQLCEKFAAKYSQNSLRKSKGYIAEECLTESRKEKLIMNFSSCDVLDSTTVGLLDHVLSFEYLKKYSIVYILLHNPSKDLFKRILSPSRKVELITKIEQIEPFSVSTGADSDVIVVESQVS